MSYKKRLADAIKIMELIGKIDKEKGTTDIEIILIDFLCFLNKNGYINDYDFVYETQIKKFIKQIKLNKMEKILKNNVTNKLRVVHFPQVGSEVGFFEVAVKDEEQAAFTVNLLANQHLWLFKNKVIPDYANIITVEMYDESIDEETGKPYGWSNYWNEEECMEWDEVEETYFQSVAVS